MKMFIDKACCTSISNRTYHVGSLAGFTLTSSIDGNDPEFVLGAFDQIGGFSLAFVTGNLCRILPERRSFLFLLDDVAGDGRSAVVFGRLPFQLHEVAVPVRDFGSSGRVRFVKGVLGHLVIAIVLFARSLQHQVLNIIHSFVFF